MHVYIDKKRCVGCGFCMDIYPLAFELGDRYACFKNTFLQTDMSEEERMEYISDAVKLCPAKAILVKKG